MKILLIIAISGLWVYAVILIIYTCLEAYYVWHPEKYQASLLWRLASNSFLFFTFSRLETGLEFEIRAKKLRY